MATNYPGKPPGWQPKGAPASAIPPTPPVAHSSGSGSGPKPKSVHPQPIGTTASPGQAIGSKPSTTTASPKGRSAAPSPSPGPGPLPRKSSRKAAVFTLPWVIITILFIVLAFDLLKYWQEGTVPIENAGWNAATYMVRTLEGNAAGNPSASRPGRQPNAGG